MNIKELQNRLIAEGCNQSCFCIKPLGLHSEGDVLDCTDGMWEVYYTERGTRHAAVFESTSESDACEYYYRLITATTHLHFVGLFEDSGRVDELEEILQNAGLEPIRNQSPPNVTGRPSIKGVLVSGKDIFTVREMYSSLPLRDCE